jgi:hypothetical protein
MLMPELITQVYARLRAMLRDLDIVGTLGTLAPDVPFALLPVTDRAGVEAVHKRLDSMLEQEPFDIGKTKLWARFALTSLTFDRAKTPDLNSFLAQMTRRHQQNVNTALEHRDTSSSA